MERTFIANKQAKKRTTKWIKIDLYKNGIMRDHSSAFILSENIPFIELKFKKKPTENVSINVFEGQSDGKKMKVI